MNKILIKTNSKNEMLDISKRIQQQIPPKTNGICHIYTPHTTAGITINEGADPSVQSDAIHFLNELVPWDTNYFKHAEGNSAAHIKAMIMGNSRTVIIENGKLQLGTWESIFLFEFDGPRTRNVWIQIITE